MKSTLKPTFYNEKGADYDFLHILQNVWKVKITPLFIVKCRFQGTFYSRKIVKSVFEPTFYCNLLKELDDMQTDSLLLFGQWKVPWNIYLTWIILSATHK